MDYREKLIERYPILYSIKTDIIDAYNILENSFTHNGKLLIAGNGGSAADAEHIVGELGKSFIKRRSIDETLRSNLCKVNSNIGSSIADLLEGGLPAIALHTHASLFSATLNDRASDIVYAQQVNTYGKAGDVFLAISTSGNSKNIINAAITAKAIGLKVIALTGKSGGELIKYSNCSIIVPENETYKIQELHLPIYHALCLQLEEHFFS